jgi:mono/diheme cytochrome c family protein
MLRSNTGIRFTLTFFALALLALALVAPGCKRKAEVKEPPRPPIHAPDRAVVQDPLSRGKMIFSGAEFSATGLSCANCHAASASAEQGRIFIAHSAYGAVARGAWWITTQAEFDAKLGQAATLVDAANKCVSAPYMGGKKLIQGDDAKALEAFYQSISDPAAKDSAPLIQTPPKALPPKGLKPDKANGKRVYEESCSHCHGMVKGIVDLTDANTWLNEVQVMAKLRHLPDWEKSNKDAKYAYHAWPYMRLAQTFGLTPAFAQAPGAGGKPPAGAAPPAAGTTPPAGASADTAAGDGGDGRIFPENAMPYFATDILSDQDVVDVAFYVIKDLPASAPAP